jgi:hydrogenase expression/formation protein HypC
LIENPKAGEYVLVHIGCAIEKIDEKYFNDLNEVFKGMRY